MREGGGACSLPDFWIPRPFFSFRFPEETESEASIRSGTRAGNAAYMETDLPRDKPQT